MIIKKLSVAGLRGFTQADFEFLPGMNLLVGVNGVGKTTALEALRVCSSKVLSELTVSTSLKLHFSIADINLKGTSMQVGCTFEHDGENFDIIILKHRENIIKLDSGNPRSQVLELADKEIGVHELRSKFPEVKKSSIQPLCVFFSTRRSMVVNKQLTGTSAKGGQEAAYVEALHISREFNLTAFAHWLQAQHYLSAVKSEGKRHIAVLEEALKTFLPGMNHLVVLEKEGWDRKSKPVLVIHKNGLPLEVDKHLSDGERGVLAIVLEIARRLSQANPGLENPLQEGEAIILIDELDLHLHPKWQRIVVENLTRTFPKCQFIVTTHSPQIIPSVEPERIQLIKDDKIIRPDRSFGMDSNWILRFIMDGEERPAEANKAIEKVEKSIDKGNFDVAMKHMAGFRKKGFDLPEWSVLEARIARLKILGKSK